MRLSLSDFNQIWTIVIQVDMDLLEAVGETRVVTQVLRNERADPEVWNALYEKTVEIAAEFEVKLYLLPNGTFDVSFVHMLLL